VAGDGDVHVAQARLTTSLSIVSAEPSTPEPTYGSPSISSSPCTVPSSPNGPCRIGSTTSIGPVGAGSGASTVGRLTSDRASAPGCSASCDDASICHPPLRSICTSTTS
jgi:hypothetical protein